MKTTPIVIALLAACLSGCTAQAGGASTAPRREFTLRTGAVDGHLAYVGMGGTIDGQVNPDLVVQSGDMVRIELVNGDGASHDLAVDRLGARTPLGMVRDKAVSMTFKAGKSGVYPYLCTVAGHRQAGMEGRLVINP